MAEALDWVIVLVAGSSLIFAFIAYREIMGTKDEVHGLVVRVHKVLDHAGDLSKVITPQFIGDTVSHALLKDIENTDGSPVTMNQYVQETMNGYVTAYGPGLKADLKEMAPSLVSQIFNASPPNPQNPGNALANERWGAGSGGLAAASKVAKASKKLPFANKVAEYVEGAQAMVQMIGPIRELKNELVGLKGGGNGGSDQVDGVVDANGSVEWGPPY